MKNLHELLCYYDPRHPDYDPDYDSEDGKKDRELKGCYCDNCFSGKHELANILIAKNKQLKDIKETLAFIVISDLDHRPKDTIDRLLEIINSIVD